jgi:hypothetical protein
LAIGLGLLSPGSAARSATRLALALLASEARAAGLSNEQRAHTLGLFARAAELAAQARDLERWRGLPGQ